MSVLVRPAAPYPHVLRHLVATRGVEVCALQASPLLGAVLGGAGAGDAGRLGLLMAGSLALTAQVFVHNDWAGYETDVRDPRRPAPVGSRDQLGRVALGLLLVAAVALGAVGSGALALGTVVALLGVLYSSASPLGKATPVGASLNHLLGGSVHFLLGYGAMHAVDAHGVAVSLFFGLVFAAGHLNQEVRDHEADRANGIRTSAVAFGPRRALLASFALFTAADGLLVGLAAAGVLPRLLMLAAGAWLLQAHWARRVLRLGLGFETACWLQRRYRLLLALVGVLMLTG